MKKMKLVMVGNGMAGVRTLEELLKIEPELYDITVFGAEPHPNYNRILLSPVLAGDKTLDEIVINWPRWYAERGIRLMLGTRAVAIDRAARQIVLDDGRPCLTTNCCSPQARSRWRRPFPASACPMCALSATLPTSRR